MAARQAARSRLDRCGGVVAMGLQDRDYMRGDRGHRGVQARAPGRAAPYVWAAAVVTGIISISVYFDGWNRRQAPVEAISSPVPPDASIRPVAPQPPPDAELPQAMRPQFRHEPASAAAAPTVVYKCVVNGRTSYSQTDSCAGDLIPVPIDGRANLIEPGSRIRERMGRSGDAMPQPRGHAEGGVAMALPLESKSIQCRALADEILAIDGAARQPQPAYVQDQLRPRRERARARQLASGC